MSVCCYVQDVPGCVLQLVAVACFLVACKQLEVRLAVLAGAAAGAAAASAATAATIRSEASMLQQQMEAVMQRLKQPPTAVVPWQ
jgi:hypothetical protein